MKERVHILIVEDSVSQVRSLQMMLEKERYVVLTATYGLCPDCMKELYPELCDQRGKGKPL
jgi:CheY-like chemotaxis protein